jgi:type IX secretion system PorP/SprF family membrane protein
MQLRKILPILIITIHCFSAATAQDFIYSQINNTSFLYNPALTGHVPSSYRLAALFRSQWASIDGGYQNYSLAGDFNRFSLTNNNMGLGLAISQETAFKGNLINNSIIGSWAYHIALDKEEKFYWSIGFQGGVATRRYKTTDIKFASGLLGGENEIISAPMTVNPDIRIGMNWTSYINSRFNFKMGAALLHIGGFQETIISNVSSTSSSVVVHGEADYYLSSSVTLQPAFFVIAQGGARQFNVGTTLYKGFESGYQFFGGLFWRYKDAMIATVGMEKNKIKVSMSYDTNINLLSVVTGFRGGFELSISYIGQVARTRHSDDLYERDYFNID